MKLRLRINSNLNRKSSGPTPGPWKLMSHSGLSWIQNSVSEMVVPDLKRAEISPENANLIAAAPDLVVALRKARSFVFGNSSERLLSEIDDVLERVGF